MRAARRRQRSSRASIRCADLVLSHHINHIHRPSVHCDIAPALTGRTHSQIARGHRHGRWSSGRRAHGHFVATSKIAGYVHARRLGRPPWNSGAGRHRGPRAVGISRVGLRGISTVFSRLRGKHRVHLLRLVADARRHGHVHPLPAHLSLPKAIA